MKTIQSDLKSKNFRRGYLLFGVEKFLVDKYEKSLADAILTPEETLMNMTIFDCENRAFSTEDFLNAINTLPFFSEKRLVVVKNSKIFAPQKKSQEESDDKPKKSSKQGNSADLFDIPEFCTVVFSETQVDKRVKSYKDFVKLHYAAEFLRPSEVDLSIWVVKTFKDFGLTIENRVVQTFLRTVSEDMTMILQEMLKLKDYVGEKKIVTEADVLDVCTKSMDLRIFEMISAISKKNAQLALEIYANLIFMKESPIMIIAMLFRQFKLILHCKTLAKQGHSQASIEKIAEIRSFVVSECLRQGKNFPDSVLIYLIKECLDADIAIKSGQIGDKLAVELLIVNCMKA